MKTPWSNLLQYGTGIATILVLMVAALIFFAVLAFAVLISKAAVFME